MKQSKFDPEDLSSTLQTLLGLQEALIGTLEQERAALKDQSYSRLGEATERKSAVCQQIEDQLRLLPAPLADLVEQAPADARQNLDAHHTRLCALAREAKDLNAVNGKIVHRSQRSVRELIGVLNGHDAYALYGAEGRSARSPENLGPAIANA